MLCGLDEAAEDAEVPEDEETKLPPDVDADSGVWVLSKPMWTCCGDGLHSECLNDRHEATDKDFEANNQRLMRGLGMTEDELISTPDEPCKHLYGVSR